MREDRTFLDKASLLKEIRALKPQVEASLDQMDRECMVPSPLIEKVRELGLFRLSWPRELGGYEADPMTQTELLEEVSRLDGSLGWITAFGAVSGFAAAKLDAVACRELFPTPDTISAGQFAPIGRADRVKGGFKVNAHWNFGSGCRHAEIMMGGVVVFEEGKPRLDTNGHPETRSVMFPTEQCTILLDSWDTLGLRGTGSYDYTVKDLFVPYEHSFNFFDPPRINAPFYVFAPLFLFCHAPIPLGIARVAIDTVTALGMEKRTPAGNYMKEEFKFQDSVGQAEAELGAARSYVYSSLAELWEILCRGDMPNARERALFRLSLVHVTTAAKGVVQLMFDAAATTAIRAGNPLERQMRDVLTLAQHRAVQGKLYSAVGRMMMGMESNVPFL